MTYAGLSTTRAVRVTALSAIDAKDLDHHRHHRSSDSIANMVTQTRSAPVHKCLGSHHLAFNNVHTSNVLIAMAFQLTRICSQPPAYWANTR